MNAKRCTFLLVLSCAVSCGYTLSTESPHSEALVEAVSPELMKQANHGRSVLGREGYFAIPDHVTRVWVDVGAHQLDTTLFAVQENSDLALIAVEPRSEAWAEWPDDRRIIALPVALGRERGLMDFHINSLRGASSLLATDPKASVLPISDLAAATVEVRKVPVLLLEDVLERIPADLDIEFLKLDIQGVDLQVLKSGNDELRRVWRVKTEVIARNEGAYLGEGEDKPGSEEEFTTFMKSVGFAFVRDWNISPERMWLDKEYFNRDLARDNPRIRRRTPEVKKSLGK